jgi:hypothetical protein
MHGPACSFWANLTPFSLEIARLAFESLDEDGDNLVTAHEICTFMGATSPDQSAEETLTVGRAEHMIEEAEAWFDAGQTGCYEGQLTFEEFFEVLAEADNAPGVDEAGDIRRGPHSPFCTAMRCPCRDAPYKRAWVEVE